MKQYRCENCKNYRLIRGMDECMVADHTPTTQERLFISQVGCASHSDFKSERDKLLDELREKYVEFLYRPCPELADKYDHCCDSEWCGLCTLDEVLEELRQAGSP